MGYFPVYSALTMGLYTTAGRKSQSHIKCNNFHISRRKQQGEL